MSNIDDLGFAYRFEAPEIRSTRTTLLLLHDVGSDENQLLVFGRQVWKEAALLAPRSDDLNSGVVSKTSQDATGVEQLLTRTEKLSQFIEKASLRYDFQFKQLVAIGYLGGATVAASLILLHPHHVGAAILLHPRLPFTPAIIRNFSELSILISAGHRDDLIRQEIERLVTIFEAGGAEVSTFWRHDGHELNSSDVDAAKAWLSEEHIRKHLAA